MELEEAIKHCKDVAYQKDLESGFDTDYERYAMTDEERTACKECAEEHRQLAEWLRDYKRLLEQQSSEDCISRANALRVAKNEYLRGWHNALCKALSEKYSIHCEEGNLSVIQEETITGLGLSMDCAVGKDVESYMSTIPSVIPKGVTVTDFADKCRECGKQKKGKWIPVSERLPDERDWYLGIFKEPDTGWINPIPYICDYVGCETEATTKDYWILNGFTNEDEHIDYYFNLECVAWRPLPEPYQEE